MTQVIITLVILFYQPPLFAQTVTVEPVFEAPKLYFKLENSIRLNFSSHVKPKKVRLSITGGELIDFNPITRIAVVKPTGSKVKISIFRKEELLETLDFKVYLVPKPEIELFLDYVVYPKKRLFSSKTALRIKPKQESVTLDGFPAFLSIKISQSEEFNRRFGSQAQYIVKKGKLMMGKEKGVLYEKTFEGNELTYDFLEGFRERQKGGDGLVLILEEVVRIDANGNEVAVNLGFVAFNLLLP
ncbi:MAG: hypothetical protein AAF740_11260 [Bacteroidota bacterium]